MVGEMFGGVDIFVNNVYGGGYIWCLEDKIDEEFVYSFDMLIMVSV